MSVLVELQERIQSTNALIAEHERTAIEIGNDPPRSLLANIRALEKLKRRLESEYLDVAADLELEVYRYRIIPDSERITLPGIAEAWLKFQEFFGATYAALTESKKGKTQKKPVQSAPSHIELGYGYSFASSVGVVITVPREMGIYATAPIEEASRTVFDLIEAKRVNAIAKDLGPAPIKALHDWIGVHVHHQYGLGLEWHSGGEIKRKTEIQRQYLSKLQDTIGQTTTSVSLGVIGKLYAVDDKAREFKFEGDNGQDYVGQFGDAITEEHAASVPARYRATIVQTTRIVVLGNEPQTGYFLQALAAL